MRIEDRAGCLRLIAETPNEVAVLQCWQEGLEEYLICSEYVPAAVIGEDLKIDFDAAKCRKGATNGS